MFPQPTYQRFSRASAGPRSLLAPGEPCPPTKGATYFQRPCPTCGRWLLIPVQYLGERVTCSHCRRAFIACEASRDPADGPNAFDSINARADRLLAALAAMGEDAPAASSPRRNTYSPRS